MKKFWFIFLSFVVLGLCIAGAYFVPKYINGNSDNLIFDDNTITVWYADESMEDYVKNACVVYEEQTGIKAVPTLVSSLEYLESVQKASVEDDGPDVYLITNDSLEKAYLSGLACKLDDPDQVLNSTYYSKTAIDAITYKDNKLGYPLSFDTAFLLYNADYVEQIAAKAAENEAAAKAAEEEFLANNPEEAEGYTDPGIELVDYSNVTAEDLLPTSIVGILDFANEFDIPEGAESFFAWAVRDVLYDYWFAGAYLNLGGECGDDPKTIDIYNEDAMYCLSVFQDFNQFFSIDTEVTDYNRVTEDFIAGKLVFTVAGTDILEKLEAAKADGSFPYEYGVTTIAMLNGDLKSKGLSITRCAVVNGYSDNKESAEDFAKFLSFDYAENMYNRTGKMSARKLDNDPYPQMAGIRSTYDNSVAIPKIVESSNYWILAEMMFTNIWDGEDVNSELVNLSIEIKKEITGGDVEETIIETPEIIEGYIEGQ